MARPNDHLADLNEVERTVEVISTGDEWIKAIDVLLDGTPTSRNSAAYDVTACTGAAVHIFIDSTGAPTDVRVLAQFTDDAAQVLWHDFEEGLWASLFWEDTDTASGIRKTYTLPISGEDTLRFRVIGTGTGAQATFAVVVKFRAFRGAYAVAHA